MAFRSEEIQIRSSAFEIVASHDFIVKKYGKSKKKSAYDNHEACDWHMHTFSISCDRVYEMFKIY